MTTATPLCIEIVFAAGPNGTPGNAAKGPYADRSTNSGTVNKGVYFTGTAPLAITLRDLNASTVATPWALILAVVIIAAAMLAPGRYSAAVPSNHKPIAPHTGLAMRPAPVFEDGAF